MSIIEAIIFGFVQGISEFLPISSTAHIILTSTLLGYDFPGLTFEIFLHIASALAVIIYFRKDLWKVISGFFIYFKSKTKENKVQFMFGLYIIIATFVTGFIGIIVEGVITDELRSPVAISIALATTGVFLILIERLPSFGERKEENMTVKDSILIGLGQALAVIPGISRSGSTLITALFSGLNKDTAVRYSFLLSIPVVLGSTVLMLRDFDKEFIAYAGLFPLVASFIVTFIFSWIGIIWLISLLKKSKLTYFAIYCLIVSVLIFIFMI